jgi:hypothetical protein
MSHITKLWESVRYWQSAIGRTVMEHRHGRRVSVKLGTRIQNLSRATQVAGRIVSMSISGALIESGFEVRELSAVEVEINSKWMLAWVVQRGPAALAVEWLEQAPETVIRQLEVAALNKNVSEDLAVA